MTEDAKGKPRLVTVASSCDPQDVAAALVLLREDVAAASPDRPILLDLSATGATALALQLLVSAAKSLDLVGASAGFGPNAQAALSFER